MALHVLLAGATGALGQHVTRELIGRSHRVRALVNRTPLSDDLADHAGIHLMGQKARRYGTEAGGLEGVSRYPKASAS